MKQFVLIIVILVTSGCANNSSKELDNLAPNADITEKEVILSEEDAYSILIKQKLQEHIDKHIIAQNHPSFSIEKENEYLFSEQRKLIKDVDLVSPLKMISDSIKVTKTKVVFNSGIDTIYTYIKTSQTIVDGKLLKTVKLRFERGKN
ncbi:hypothetical protein [Aquimarina aggregata]|uniref:hypothetical protein n=1 Tax=Aquimarina aggregata TaxID=1642818 RepID=UPI002491AA8A|nr:hypothetical protein [Aquimarina aggregata]